jgi:uncharacterized protein
MILEGLITTTDAHGQPHLAPMGPTVTADMDSFLLRPFPTSNTYKNLLAHGEGVLHVTDDARMLAYAAVGKLNPMPPTRPAGVVRGFILTQACRYFEFRVRSIDTSAERVRIEADVVARGTLRDFFGFNRARHAVLEAAILATRFHLLPSTEIEAEFVKLAVIVDKTGGAGGHADVASRMACLPGEPPVIEITTPTRLHFGLIHVPQSSDPPHQRRFGGCGLMIQDPAIKLTVETASEWDVRGFHVDRVRKLAEALSPGKPLRVCVTSAPGEHQGFGLGTQLSLAVAEAIHLARGLQVPADLAVAAGRGERSGIGVHGYHSGGFIVDGGKRSSSSAILGVETFPDWPIVLVTPATHSYWAGADERAAFASLQTPSVTAELCERLLFGLWPALKEQDFKGFSEHLYCFNRLAATPFLAAQGGVYSSQDVAARRLKQ